MAAPHNDEDNGNGTPRRRREDYMEASGFGASIRAGGPNVIMVILILALAGIGVYAYIDTQSSLRHVLEELQLMTYVLSQPPEQRPVIYPPRALWERIDEGKARLKDPHEKER